MSLDSNSIVYDKKVVALTPTQAAFMSVLNEKYGTTRSYAHLHRRIYGNVGSDAVSMDVLKTIACQTRKRINPLGLDIESVYGVGFRLQRLTRTRSRRVVQDRAAA